MSSSTSRRQRRSAVVITDPQTPLTQNRVRQRINQALNYADVYSNNPALSNPTPLGRAQSLPALTNTPVPMSRSASVASMPTPLTRATSLPPLQHSPSMPNVTAPPSYQKGGMIPRTGVYLLHKGEVVVPAHRVKTVKKAMRKAGMKPLKN